jgi:hypothetical protein
MTVIYKLIALFLFQLLATSVVGDGSNGMLLDNYTIADYGFWNNDLMVGMSIRAPNSHNAGISPTIRFDVFDHRDWSWVRAGGYVPASVVKVTGNSISVDIKDAREFIGPEFFVDESGHPGPLPIRATVIATRDWEERMKGGGTAHGPLGEGGYRNSWSRYTSSSAVGTWKIAGYLFANSAARFWTGDVGFHELARKSYCAMSICSDVLRSGTMTADRSNDWLYRNRTLAYYESGAGNMQAIIGIDVPSNGTTAMIDLMLWDPRDGPLYIQASGYVPVSHFRVTGTMVSVNISDLRQFVSPEFFLDDGGYLGPIPMKVTARKTADSQGIAIGTRTERQAQPDGTIVVHSEKEKYIVASASFYGQVADHALPVSESRNDGSSGSFIKGDFRARTR